MHQTSHSKMNDFFNKFIPKDTEVKILEIGSKIYENQESYKKIFDQNINCKYFGCDIEEGMNVDIVMENPYNIPVPSDSYDFVISGQAFEHIEFFWLTALEMARVLKPNGTLIIIAPGAGPIHEYPIDCWRYNPDGMSALCKWMKLELIEASQNMECRWCDSTLIAKKTLGVWIPRIFDVII